MAIIKDNICVLCGEPCTKTRCRACYCRKSKGRLKTEHYDLIERDSVTKKSWKYARPWSDKWKGPLRGM